MTSSLLHSRPSWPVVLEEQIRATGIAIRRESAIAAILLAGVMTLVVSSYLVGGGESFHFNLTEMTFPAIVLGFFVSMAVWKEEGPSRRSYLWTLPVDRARLSLARVLGGWLWYMALVAGYLLWAMALAALTGGDVGVEEARYLIAELPAGTPATDADFYVHRIESPAWMWLVPFTAATTTYLLGSAVVLSSDHPWRWLAGVVFAYLLLGALEQAGQAGRPGRAVTVATEGRFGLEIVFTGVANEETTLVTPDGSRATVVLDVPRAKHWGMATLLWGGIGLIGVLAAAYRHLER